MKSAPLSVVKCSLLAMLCALLLACGSGEPQVRGAWVREASPGSTVNAGYLEIHNPGQTPLILQGVESPQFGAIEIHEMRPIEDRLQMHRVSSLTIAPGETLALKPGGLHLMLFRAATRPLVGQTIPFTLLFDARKVTFNASVRRDPP